jgi:hypothetical protein
MPQFSISYRYDVPDPGHVTGLVIGVHPVQADTVEGAVTWLKALHVDAVNFQITSIEDTTRWV